MIGAVNKSRLQGRSAPGPLNKWPQLEALGFIGVDAVRKIAL